MEFASLAGHRFSVSEQTAVAQSTKILLTQTKQSRVKIWGKVYAFKSDYIITQCIGLGALSTCITFYSTDGGLSFSMLEPATLKEIALSQKLKGVYMGDPAYEYRVTDDQGHQTTVKESVRLASFISLHDHHCRVIPRGSQLLHEDGDIHINDLFEGLDREGAGKLASYVHLRQERRNASLLEKEGVCASADFLDPLTDDIPAGVWTLKYEPELDVVYGASLLFIGAVFYHRPATRIFNNIYMGDGAINQDCVFMM